MSNGKELIKNLDKFSALESEISDRKLFDADIHANIAYAGELFRAGILTRRESEKIINGLHTLLKRSNYDGKYLYNYPSQNVHEFIEKNLIQLVGEVGKKLQTGRNQTEQTLTALRIWLRAQLEIISNNLRDLQKIFVRRAESQKDAFFVIFANREKNQPISWAHFCLAYFEIFARDRERLDEVWRRTNILPHSLESSFELDVEEIAAELGFEGISANSLDAWTDLDFASESIGIFALIMLHFSRLSEDLIFYSAENRKFLKFDEKLEIEKSVENKILHILEHFRTKTAQIIGNQTIINSLQNGVSTNREKNIDEIKNLIFDSVDILKICSDQMRAIFEIVRANEKTVEKFIEEFFVSSDGIVFYLINQDVPLRIAEEISSKIVAYATLKNKKLRTLTLEEFQDFASVFKPDVFEFLSVEAFLSRRNQIGGTAPERVFEALEMAKIDLDREENENN